MKQAIQLEIPFDDMPQQVAAVKPTHVDTTELRMLAAARKAADAAKMALGVVIAFTPIAAAVVGCFALMFFAALLQG